MDNGVEGGSPSRRSAAGMGSHMRQAAAEAGAVVVSATHPSFAVPVPGTDAVSLTPVAPSAWSSSCSDGSVNNCSFGLRIDYCDSSVLFLGDAEAEEEEALALEPATLSSRPFTEVEPPPLLRCANG